MQHYQSTAFYSYAKRAEFNPQASPGAERVSKHVGSICGSISEWGGAGLLHAEGSCLAQHSPHAHIMEWGKPQGSAPSSGDSGEARLEGARLDTLHPAASIDTWRWGGGGKQIKLHPISGVLCPLFSLCAAEELTEIIHTALPALLTTLVSVRDQSLLTKRKTCKETNSYVMNRDMQ